MPPMTQLRTTAVRKIQFCAGHRVMNHGSKCRNLHGHNYIAEIFVSAPALNDLGMVTDFGVIKEVVGEWIDKYWDHGFIYYKEDTAVYAALTVFEENDVSPDGTYWRCTKGCGVLRGQEAATQHFNRTTHELASCRPPEVIAAAGEFTTKKFELPTNPTAENMAAYLLETANRLFKDLGKRGEGLFCTKVRLWETENCWVDVEVPAVFYNLEQRLGPMDLPRPDLSAVLDEAARRRLRGSDLLEKGAGPGE